MPNRDFLWSIRSARARCAAVFLACVGMLRAFLPAAADTPTLHEYELKAGVLFNIIKYVDWPSAANGGPSDTLEIGLLGDIPFANALEVLNGKTVQGRKLSVRRIHSVADAGTCRVLYIGASEKAQLPEITAAFKDRPILTVSEVDGFAEAGGMVNLLTGPNRIVMEINREAAKHYQLGSAPSC